MASEFITSLSANSDSVSWLATPLCGAGPVCLALTTQGFSPTIAFALSLLRVLVLSTRGCFTPVFLCDSGNIAHTNGTRLNVLDMKDSCRAVMPALSCAHPVYQSPVIIPRWLGSSSLWSNNAPALPLPILPESSSHCPVIFSACNRVAAFRCHSTQRLTCASSAASQQPQQPGLGWSVAIGTGSIIPRMMLGWPAHALMAALLHWDSGMAC